MITIDDLEQMLSVIANRPDWPEALTREYIVNILQRIRCSFCRAEWIDKYLLADAEVIIPPAG